MQFLRLAKDVEGSSGEPQLLAAFFNGNCTVPAVDGVRD